MAQPALAERCRAVALAQGERPECANGLKRRVMGLLDTDPGAFSDLLLRTELQLGPVLRAIMGDHAFLDSWHSFTLYPEAPKAGTPPYRATWRGNLEDFDDDELLRARLRRNANSHTRLLLFDSVCARADSATIVRLSWRVVGVFECVDATVAGGGLWRRKPRLTWEQVRAAWAHDAHHDGVFPSVQTIWMLSEFNGANGGTRLLRDTWRERRQPRREDRPRFVANCIPATGEPGDVLVYVGQTWHSEGVNTTQVSAVQSAAAHHHSVSVHKTEFWSFEPIPSNFLLRSAVLFGHF